MHGLQSLEHASGRSQQSWRDLCGEGHTHPKTAVINIVTMPHDAVAVTAVHTSQPHTPEVILGGGNNTRSRGSGLCSTNICPSLGKDKQGTGEPGELAGARQDHCYLAPRHALLVTVTHICT